eukprot:COSAG06_NODE_1973_length_7938_cov_3.557852_8_plen_80_part_00
MAVALALCLTTLHRSRVWHPNNREMCIIINLSSYGRVTRDMMMQSASTRGMVLEYEDNLLEQQHEEHAAKEEAAAAGFH